MENFNHKQYRGDLYNKLVNEPDKEKRSDILYEEKIKEDYRKSEELHKGEIKNRQNNTEFNSHDFDDSFVSMFTQDYVNRALIPERKLKGDYEKCFSLLKERLPNSVLVDLGCGDLWSVGNAYEFATAFDVRKYIGVEKYPSDSENKYTDYIENLKLANGHNNTEIFKELINQKHKFPPYQVLLGQDMLKFLEKRTEQSNFMMNGVDQYVLDLNKKNNIESLYKFQEQIARLVPKGGLVFGLGSTYLGKLEEFGFKAIKKEFGIGNNYQFWEKI